MRVIIAGCGVISPVGRGFELFTEGLLAGKCGIHLEQMEGLQRIPVARVVDFQTVPGEDRSISLLRPCLAELASVFEALNAFIPPQERGAFAATSKGGVLQELLISGSARTNFPSLWACAISTFLAQETNAQGPVGSYVGACATGLANIIRAARSVQAGECAYAVAGSSEATLHSAYIASFLNLNAYSQQGSFPFDVRHNGFVAGEGAAVLVLTTPENAEKAGLTPVAEIVSWAEGADAYHPVGIDLSGEVIATVGEKAWQRAGKPLIQAISCHGTATPANDCAEAAAIKSLQNKWNQHSLYCHSLKGATGHLMGAAGSVESVSVISMLNRQEIPLTVGLITAAPECSHLRFPCLTQPQPLVHILKWSFGFGGHIAGVIFKAWNKSSG
ncbi:MAG: beta-ketoacyl-[acyl-carrier-protein] synthase family protein [Sumerlaeia bacterium]